MHICIFSSGKLFLNLLLQISSLVLSILIKITVSLWKHVIGLLELDRTLFGGVRNTLMSDFYSTHSFLLSTLASNLYYPPKTEKLKSNDRIKIKIRETTERLYRGLRYNTAGRVLALNVANPSPNSSTPIGLWALLGVISELEPRVKPYHYQVWPNNTQNIPESIIQGYVAEPGSLPSTYILPSAEQSRQSFCAMSHVMQNFSLNLD